jgi:hypothetical protein
VVKYHSLYLIKNKEYIGGAHFEYFSRWWITGEKKA